MRSKADLKVGLYGVASTVVAFVRSKADLKVGLYVVVASTSTVLASTS